MKERSIMQGREDEMYRSAHRAGAISDAIRELEAMLKETSGAGRKALNEAINRLRKMS